MFNWFLKKVEEPVARPRTIDYEGGTISLSGYSKEIADSIEDRLLGGNAAQASTSTGTETKVALGVLTHDAVGNYFDKNGWHVVNVRFSPISREAQVSEVLDVGPEKAEAIEKFKIMAVEKNIV